MENKNDNFESRKGRPEGIPDEVAEKSSEPHYPHIQYPQPPEWTKNIVVSDKPWIPSGEEGNVSVSFNEPEKAESPQAEPDYELTVEKELPMRLQIGIVAFIALVALLLAFSIAKLRAPDENTDISVQIPTTAANATVTAIPTTAAATSEITATEKLSQSTTEVKESSADDVTTEAASVSETETTENKEEIKRKIVEYFNESSNRVKTESVKVVKDFEKRTHNADKLVLPSAIKSVGQSLLESKITDITESVEYSSREEIIAKYPVPGAEWSSCLDADDVTEAVCTENGDEYEITLYLKDCVDPSPGTGTSKAMDCLDVPTVRDTAPPFITAFSAEYYDCVILCRVEKDTGRIVWADYTAPVLLKLGLDAGFVEFDAEIGITFEKSYTVTY